MFELRDNTGVLGSFDSEGIRRLANEGRLHGQMEIRQLPAGGWHPISKVKNLPVGAMATPPPPLPPTAQPVPIPTAISASAPPVATVADPVYPCHFCGEPIKWSAKKCKHCGEFLDPTLRAAQAPAQPFVFSPPSTTVNVSNVVHVGGHAKRWSRLVAMILSFLIPGLGQIYKGQVINGVVWFVVVVIGYAAFVVPGLILHFCCILGAASGDPYR